MRIETTFATAFLVMSCFSLFWQAWMLHKLIDLGVRGAPKHSGLLRTSLCRVGAAVLYVAVGSNALFIGWEVPSVTFGAFCAVQLLWQINAFADVRLRQRLVTPKRPGQRLSPLC